MLVKESLERFVHALLTEHHEHNRGSLLGSDEFLDLNLSTVSVIRSLDLNPSGHLDLDAKLHTGRLQSLKD